MGAPFLPRPRNDGSHLGPAGHQSSGIPLAGLNIPEYKSRGKGRGGKMCRTNFFRGSPSRYSPHQGKQEIARRFARMQKSCLATTQS